MDPKDQRVLIWGIDGLGPNTIFKYLDDFPLYKDVYETGSHGVNMGYPCSPTAWANFYLGVPEDLHGLTPANGVGRMRDGRQEKILYDREFGVPIWEHLNNHGFSAGLFKTLYSGPSHDINGFMYGAIPRCHVRDHDSLKDKYANNAKVLTGIVEGAYRRTRRGHPPKPGVPFHFEIMSGGRTWDQCTPQQRHDIVRDYMPYIQYKNVVDYYDWHTPLETAAITDLLKFNNVNMLMIYCKMTDEIQHFQFHEPNIYTIRQAIHASQRRFQRIVEVYKPTHIIITSDHGIDIMRQPDTTTSQLPSCINPLDGNLLVKAILVKGGIVSGEHVFEGMYMVRGPGIKINHDCPIKLYQLYQLICEIFKIPLPEGYKSEPMDVWSES